MRITFADGDHIAIRVWMSQDWEPLIRGSADVCLPVFPT